MITKELLNKIFENGDKLYEYLTNKHTGGRNNSKGNTFENQFTVYKIVCAFNEEQNAKNTFFSSQVLCFIDDLFVEKIDLNIVEHYQIKDVFKLSWLGNPHPLKDDFLMQHNICSADKQNAILQLIVSSDELKKELDNSMPEEIREIASVVHFEKASSINNLLRVNKEFKSALSKMCAINNPSIDKLDTLGNIILGVWSGLDQEKKSLDEILNKCFAQNPHYIRGFQNKISNQLHEIFTDIPDFNYIVEGGYIKWSYGASDEGTVSCRIGSAEYENWENEIFNSGPFANFEEIEQHLV